ncbi:MAG: M48 family metallopeptidase [Blastocatellales bacterium]|nr:M48 family metallopeptidase [Blastocatellales bacterium]
MPRPDSGNFVSRIPGAIQYAHHGKPFYDLLQRVLPDWEQRKARLERIFL